MTTLIVTFKLVPCPVLSVPNIIMTPDFVFTEPLAFGPLYLFLCAYELINTALIIPSLVFLVKRRKHRVIAHRSPITLVAHLSFSYIIGLVQVLSILMGKEEFCTTIDILYGCFLFFIMHFLMVTPTIVSHIQINQDKTSEVKSPWTKTALFFTRLPVRLSIHFVVGVIHLVVSVIFYLYVELESYGECNRAVFMAYAFTLTVISCCIGGFVTKLLFASDPFFLRMEMFVSMVLHFPTTILLSLMYGFAPGIFPSWFDYRWLNPMMGLQVTLTSAVFPLLLTNDKFLIRLQRQLSHLRGSRSMDIEAGLANHADSLILSLTSKNADILQVIVENDVLRESFKAYCNKNWSVENLLFYMAVRDFKIAVNAGCLDNSVVGCLDNSVVGCLDNSVVGCLDNSVVGCLDNSIVETANIIYDNFIMAGSCTEINIDSGTRRNIADRIKLNNIGGDMFNAAEHHIVNLMTQDTVVGWQATSEGRDAWKQASQRQLSSQKLTKRNSERYSEHTEHTE